jgi:hypothetical protein
VRLGLYRILLIVLFLHSFLLCYMFLQLPYFVSPRFFFASGIIAFQGMAAYSADELQHPFSIL